jgi:hypothetical protein
LEVEQKESSQFGSWLHRCDPFVVDDNLLEEQPSQAIALLWQGRCPGCRYMRQERGQAGEARCVASAASVQEGELPL